MTHPRPADEPPSASFAPASFAAKPSTAAPRAAGADRLERDSGGTDQAASAADGAPSDAALCRRLAHGRQPAARDALAALHARHAAALLAFLRRRRPDLAEDLLQETFLALAHNAGQFEGASARPWLLALARSRLARAARSERTAADHHARYAADRAVGDARTPADPPLAAALERLTPEHAAVLELRFAQDLTHAETAALLGVSLRTAKARTTAALAALRRALERA